MSRQCFSMPGAVRLVDRDADCWKLNSTKWCALQSSAGFFWYLRGANSPHCVTTLCFAFSFIFFGWTFTTPLFFTYCWPLGWHLGRVPTMKPVQPPKPIFAYIPKHIVGCLADCNFNRVPETLNYHGLRTFQCRPGKQPHHKKRHQIFRRTQLQGHGVDGCPGVLLLQWLWRGILGFLRLNTAWFHCLPSNRDNV